MLGTKKTTTTKMGSMLFSAPPPPAPLTKILGSAHAVNAHVCTKATINAPFFVSRGPYLLLNLHLHLTYAPVNLRRLTWGNTTGRKITWHCTVLNEPSLFERKMLIHFSAQICPIVCYCIAVDIIARLHSRAVGSLLEKKENIIVFFFSVQFMSTINCESVVYW